VEAETLTLYERIGGEPVICRLVDRFYDRVMDDPELQPFFRNSSIARLRTMQNEFFSAALDGPVKYSGNDLTSIHRNRGITRYHLGRFVNHLTEVLDSENMVSHRDAMEIVVRIAASSDQIIGESGGEDG